MLFRILLSSLSILCVGGVAIPSTYEVHERRETLHPRWLKGSRIAPYSTLPMRVGLAQNFENAEEYLMEVSDPDSPKFGQYWSSEEVIEKFKPSDIAIKAVHDWLTGSGIAASRIAHSDNKGWLAFDATGAEAEALLHTEFYEHHDTVSGGRMPACEAYHLPSSIREHVDYITPGIKLMVPTGSVSQIGRKDLNHKRDLLHGLRKAPSDYQRSAQASSSSANLSTCDQAITPACIAALYRIPPTNKNETPVADNALGIFESEAEYYAQEDLDSFFQNFTKYIPQGTHPELAAIDGGLGPTSNVSDAGGEADLDLQLAYPIVYPQSIILYDVDDPLYQLNPNITYTFGFNTFLDALDGSYCNYTAYGETGDSSIDPQYPDPRPGGYNGQLQCGIYEPTNVISISYGGQEADVPYAYQRRQCNEYLKLGLQGVSILFASGDAGKEFLTTLFEEQRSVKFQGWAIILLRTALVIIQSRDALVEMGHFSSGLILP